MSFDMPLHVLRDALDIARNIDCAARPETFGLAGENLQGRLEAMGKIGCPRSGFFQLGVAGVEQAVDLARKRLHLVGKSRPEAAAFARADGDELCSAWR